MMKNAKSIFAAVAAACILTGCPNPESDLYIGQQVRFTAATSYLNGWPNTRTAYSGMDESGNPVGTSSNYERIDWVTGDLFRIFSPNATHANYPKYIDSEHYARYRVTGVSHQNGVASKARITPADGNGLIWGTGGHDFYCVYPDPSTEGLNDDDVTIDGNIITGRVYASQNAVWEQATDIEAKVDMKYAYMYAAVKNQAPKSEVNLYFKPMVTAFRITVTSSDDNVLTLTKLVMESSAGPIAGTFKKTITAATTDEAQGSDVSGFTSLSEGASNTIEVNLNGHKVYKNASAGPTSATFTVFALPLDISGLTLKLYTSASSAPRTLALNQNDSPVTFPACRKAYINNIGIPGGWTYNMDPIADIRVTDVSVLENLTREITVHTWKSATGLTKDGVKWKMYFMSGRPSVGNTVNVAYKEAPLEQGGGGEYVTFTSLEGDGKSNVETVSLSAATLSPKSVRTYTDGPQITELQKDENAHDGLDLSKYDFMTKDPNCARETANCYIIDGYGSYRIPLVYGNAIRNDIDNISAYNRTVVINPSDNDYNFGHLSTLLNADGEPISSPWILNDENLTKSGNYDVRVVWQDTPKGYEIVHDNIPSTRIAGTGYEKFIEFTIAKEDIKPGNVIIALHDIDNDKILWNWHLWLLGEDLSTKRVSKDGLTVDFLSANLGWSVPLVYERRYTPSRSQYAIIVCDEDGPYKNKVLGSFQIYEQYAIAEIKNILYSNTYYQWGRKDPLLTLSGNGKEGRRYSSEYYVTGLPSSESGQAYNQALRERHFPTSALPATIISSSIQYPNEWIGGYFKIRNLWNTNLRLKRYGSSGFELRDLTAPTVKTVYDPCPRGFAVPRRACFSVLMDLGDDYIAIGEVEQKGVAIGTSGSAALPRGFRFNTDNGDNDLCFYRTGYRGYTTSNAQPGTWAEAWTSDVTDRYDLHYANRNENYTVSNSSYAFIYNPLQSSWNVADGDDSDIVIKQEQMTYFWSDPSYQAYPVRPVVDHYSVSAGISSAGQAGQSHDFSDRDWN